MPQVFCCKYTGGVANSLTTFPLSKKGYCCGFLPIELIVGFLGVLAWSFTVASLTTEKWILFEVAVSDPSMNVLGATDFATFDTDIGLYRAVDVFGFRVGRPIAVADDDFSGDGIAAAANIMPDGGIVPFKWYVPSTEPPRQRAPTARLSFPLSVADTPAVRSRTPPATLSSSLASTTRRAKISRTFPRCS